MAWWPASHSAGSAYHRPPSQVLETWLLEAVGTGEFSQQDY